MITTNNAFDFMMTLLTNGHSDETIETFLRHYQEKEWQAQVLVEFVKAIKLNAKPCPLPKNCLDICGTGGSEKSRFNVSSASAFVLASLGIPVAKHGNYGSASSNGSFNFLEALGLIPCSDVQKIQSVFQKTNLAFLLARQWHPALANLAPIRKKIGGSTVFNLLGPLCNPANPETQLIGTTSYTKAKLLAETVSLLQESSAIIVVGADGRDEVSLSGETLWITANKKEVRIESKPFSLFENDLLWEKNSPYDGQHNAKVFLSLIQKGDTTHPISQYIALNAGAALCAYQKTDILEGYQLALKSIKEKKVDLTLKQYLSLQ